MPSNFWQSVLTQVQAVKDTSQEVQLNQHHARLTMQVVHITRRCKSGLRWLEVLGVRLYGFLACG